MKKKGSKKITRHYNNKNYYNKLMNFNKIPMKYYNKSMNYYSTDKLIPTTRHNPCPICGNTKGDCREKEGLNLCMKSHGDDYKNIGFKYVGDTKDDLWGMYVEFQGETSLEDKKSREARLKIIKEKKEKAKKEALKRSLSESQRDKAIQDIANYLGLSNKHHKALLQRGLSEEDLKKGLYFSAYDYPSIPNYTPLNLSGVGINPFTGDLQINKKGSAIACPFFNADGLAIGWQWRNETEENKYTWAYTKGISSHLANGELPVTYVSNKLLGREDNEAIKEWFGSVDKSKGFKIDIKDDEIRPIFITEGSLKPFIAASKLGIETIGAAGFNFSGSPKQVEEIVKKGNYNLAIFPVDAGGVENKNIINHLEKNIELFMSFGCDIAIGWWQQWDKTNKDVDELDSLNDISGLIAPDSFLEIASKRIFLKQKLEKTKDFNSAGGKIEIENTQLIKQGEKRNMDIEKAIEPHKVIVLKSAMKTGKTYFLTSLVDRYREEGKKIIVIGSRRILTYSQGDKWGLHCVRDQKDAPVALEHMIDEHRGCAVVVDSLDKLRDIDFSDCLVILDECSQLTTHTLTSSTAIRDKRGFILKLLEDKLRQAEKIIACDANVNKIDIEWLHGITGEEPFTIKNNYQSHHNDLILYEKKVQEQFYDDLFTKVKAGTKILIPSDNKTSLEALYQKLTEEFPDKKHVLITADTVRDDYYRAFIENPNYSIETEKPDTLLLSPVAQSGISIDTRHFEEVFAIFSANVPPDICRQMMLRERNDIPRRALIEARGRFESNYDWEEILEEDTGKYLESKFEYLKELGKYNCRADIIQAIADEMRANNDRLADYNSVAKAKIQAKRNIDLSEFKRVFVQQCEEEGYVIKTPIETEFSSFSYDEKKAKKEVLLDRAEKIYKAEDILIDVARLLAKRESLTQQQELEVQKAFIIDAYPEVELCTDFIYEEILKNKRKNLNAVYNYFLAKNPEFAKTKDIKALNNTYYIALKGGKLWQGDIKARSVYPEVWEALKLDNIVNSTEQISGESKIVDEFMRLVKVNRALLRKINIKFNKKTYPIVLLRKVLGKFGFVPSFVETRRIKNKATKFFIINKSLDEELHRDLLSGFKIRVTKEESLNADLFNNMEEFSGKNNFQNRSIAESRPEHGLECVTNSQLYINNNIQLVTASTPCLPMDSAIDRFRPKKSQNNQQISINEPSQATEPRRTSSPVYATTDEDLIQQVSYIRSMKISLIEKIRLELECRANLLDGFRSPSLDTLSESYKATRDDVYQAIKKLETDNVIWYDDRKELVNYAKMDST